jgi:2,3-bisphosphoglycerate-dependent phosphoglycerate mutase
MRHGTSAANLVGRTAGWQDVALSAQGEEDAHLAARAIGVADITIDVVYASALTRAGRTAELVAADLGLPNRAIRRRWRLNERHAGAFEGMTRDEMLAHAGREVVRAWKHQHTARPPGLEAADRRHPAHDPRYSGVPHDLLPSGESTSDVLHRLLPVWEEEIVATLASGQSVLVVSHEHVLRVFTKHLTASGGSFPEGALSADRIPWAFDLDPGGARAVNPVRLDPPTDAW